jgi:hypothetical protein
VQKHIHSISSAHLLRVTFRLFDGHSKIVADQITNAAVEMTFLQGTWTPLQPMTLAVP